MEKVSCSKIMRSTNIFFDSVFKRLRWFAGSWSPELNRHITQMCILITSEKFQAWINCVPIKAQLFHLTRELKLWWWSHLPHILVHSTRVIYMIFSLNLFPLFTWTCKFTKKHSFRSACISRIIFFHSNASQTARNSIRLLGSMFSVVQRDRKYLVPSVIRKTRSQTAYERYGFRR